MSTACEGEGEGERMRNTKRLSSGPERPAQPVPVNSVWRRCCQSQGAIFSSVRSKVAFDRSGSLPYKHARCLVIGKCQVMTLCVQMEEDEEEEGDEVEDEENEAEEREKKNWKKRRRRRRAMRKRGSRRKRISGGRR